MNGPAAVKKYPIQKLWILKIAATPLLSLAVLAAVFIYLSYHNIISASILKNYNMLLIMALGLFALVMPTLKVLTFRYYIEDKFLTLKQGIVSRQERHIPYGVIQNIFIKQDLFDRIFGLASLMIENASKEEPGQRTQVIWGITFAPKNQRQELVGFMGNRVNIPGLKKVDAEMLKNAILQKMKENPMENKRSGL